MPEAEEDDLLAFLQDVPETGMTPGALKALSKSVMDISHVPDVKDIAASSGDLMTGKLFKKKELKRKVGVLDKRKSESRTSLISMSSSADTKSLSTIEVRLRTSIDLERVEGKFLKI